MPASILPFSYSLTARLPLLSVCEQGIIVGSFISPARKRKPHVVIPWTVEPVFSDGRIVWNNRSIVSGLSIEELARLKEEWKVLKEANDAGNYGASPFSAKRLIASDEIEHSRERANRAPIAATASAKYDSLFSVFVRYASYLRLFRRLYGTLPGDSRHLQSVCLYPGRSVFCDCAQNPKAIATGFFQAALIFLAPPYALRSAQRLYAAALSGESAVTVGLALLEERERDAKVDCMILYLKHPIHDEGMIEKANTGRAEQEWLIAPESIADRSVAHAMTNDTGRIYTRCLQLYELNAKEYPYCPVRF